MEEAFEHLNNNRIDLFFQALDGKVPNEDLNTYNQLKQEFLSNRFGSNFTQRLIVFLKNLPNSSKIAKKVGLDIDKDISRIVNIYINNNPWPYVVMFGLFILLLGFVAYLLFISLNSKTVTAQTKSDILIEEPNKDKSTANPITEEPVKNKNTPSPIEEVTTGYTKIKIQNIIYPNLGNYTFKINTSVLVPTVLNSEDKYPNIDIMLNIPNNLYDNSSNVELLIYNNSNQKASIITNKHINSYNFPILK